MPDMIKKIVEELLGNSVTEVDIEHILPHVQVKVLEAGRILFIEDSIEENNYYLIQGLMKSYFEKDKKKIITNFIMPGNIISNLPSEIAVGKAWETVEAVTKVKLLYLTKESLFKICKEIFIFGQLYLDAVTKLRKNQINRLGYINNKNAVQKIENFLNTYAVFTNAIPQYEIASFLNVSPETLCRARRKFLQKTRDFNYV